MNNATQDQIDRTWEWLGEWKPIVDSTDSVECVEALAEIMACDAYDPDTQPHTIEAAP